MIRKRAFFSSHFLCIFVSASGITCTTNPPNGCVYIPFKEGCSYVTKQKHLVENRGECNDVSIAECIRSTGAWSAFTDYIRRFLFVFWPVFTWITQCRLVYLWRGVGGMGTSGHPLYPDHPQQSHHKELQDRTGAGRWSQLGLEDQQRCRIR